MSTASQKRADWNKSRRIKRSNFWGSKSGGSNKDIDIGANQKTKMMSGIHAKPENSACQWKKAANASAESRRQKDMADTRQKVCARAWARREAITHAVKQRTSSPSWVASETA